ncbi:MAG TPA: hypothetical protein VMU20_20650 [Candidatus Dormibacteraeota bacterium]|nr:hypothetical protein [Candidatus Dormibacteraeota bacterium]
MTPAAGLAVVAVLGAWLGHGLEALRLQGPAGFVASVSGPIHLYMLPAAAGCAVSATVLAVWCWRLWRDLGRRLTRARRLLRRSWRGAAAELAAPDVRHHGAGVPPFRLLWPALALAQLAIYVVQENLETTIAGRSAPGFGVLGGVHRPVALVCRLLERRHRLAVGCERLVRALLLLRGRRVAARRGGLLWLRPPHDRLGAQLWCRPPPLAAV